MSQLKLAQAMNTGSFDLRERQVQWLIAMGQSQEAFEQAQVIQYLWPGDARVQKILEMAAEADARGSIKSSGREKQP